MTQTLKAKTKTKWIFDFTEKSPISVLFWKSIRKKRLYLPERTSRIPMVEAITVMSRLTNNQKVTTEKYSLQFKKKRLVQRPVYLSELRSSGCLCFQLNSVIPFSSLRSSGLGSEPRAGLSICLLLEVTFNIFYKLHLHVYTAGILYLESTLCQHFNKTKFKKMQNRRAKGKCYWKSY